MSVPLKVTVTFLLIVFSLAFSPSQDILMKSSSGILESSVTAVAVSSTDQAVFAGTTRAVYRSDNGGRNYQRICAIPGSSGQVNFLYITKGAPHTVYAATDSGLFAGANHGQSWQQLFSPGNENDRRCLSVLEEKGTIYLGTAKGLLIKPAGSSVWLKEKQIFAGKPVQFILQCHPEPQRGEESQDDFIFIATDTDVFQLDQKNQKYSKVFSSLSKQNNGDAEVEDLENSTRRYPIKALSFSQKTQELYLATSHGLFVSPPHGKNWQKIRTDGLPLDEISVLVAKSSGDIYAGTGKGLFHYQGSQWQPLYKGLETNQINDLAVGAQNNLIVASARGIFLKPGGKAVPEGSLLNRDSLLTSLAWNDGKHQDDNSWPQDDGEAQEDIEPPIREVHEMAISYAEVHPGKIENWRRLAQKRAWLPDLDIDLGFDKNRTTSDSLWGSSSSGGTHYLGPDDKTFYDNFGWDISLSWDLGDLVWSTDQTTIDSRSKMMVELREDILNEVTRIYFERRRLQAQVSSGVEGVMETPQERALRIEELTALIDAMTGGEFSREIIRRRNLKGLQGHKDTRTQGHKDTGAQ